jgi:hypothetical protein
MTATTVAAAPVSLTGALPDTLDHLTTALANAKTYDDLAAISEGLHEVKKACVVGIENNEGRTSNVYSLLFNEAKAALESVAARSYSLTLDDLIKSVAAVSNEDIAKDAGLFNRLLSFFTTGAHHRGGQDDHTRLRQLSKKFTQIAETVHPGLTLSDYSDGFRLTGPDHCADLEVILERLRALAPESAGKTTVGTRLDLPGSRYDSWQSVLVLADGTAQFGTRELVARKGRVFVPAGDPMPLTDVVTQLTKALSSS